MKVLLAFTCFICFCFGCSSMNEIEFVYFNLSPNEIVVDSVAGLPPWASPGVLVPSHEESLLSEKSATSYDGPAAIPATLIIIWQEGGTSHQSEFKRDDFGIPVKFKQGKIRFTYLGGEKWRIKYLNN